MGKIGLLSIAAILLFGLIIPFAAQPEGAPAPGPAPARFADPSPRRDAARPRRDDEPVIGLGDHVPSFLLRPVPKRVRHPHDHERIEAEE